MLGCSPTTPSALRAAIVKGLCIRKPSGCATTALESNGYGKKDSLINTAIENILGFVQAVQVEGWSPTTQRAWNNTIAQAKEGLRWGKVRGPMGSCICTLMDWGWTPLQANVWVDPAGCQWTWNFSRTLVVDAIREVLKIRFKEFLWTSRAPLHFAGPSYIPDFGAAYALRKKFRKEQDWRR